MSLSPFQIFSQFTSVEAAFLQNFAGLTFTEGDVLYIDSNGDVANLGIGTTGQVLTVSSGGIVEWTTVAGTGDVTAASAFGTDNVLIRSDGTGKGVQATGIVVSDTTNDISGVGDITLGGFFDISEIATPANPAANVGRLYAADDGGTTKLYFKDSAGTTTDLLASISDGDKGDITVSSSGATWTIDNNVVTFAKMQDIATGHLIGRHTAGSGDPEQITIDGGIELSGANLRRSALTGAITATAGSNTTSLGSFTSAQLAAAVTDETGSGALVFGTAPEFSTGIGINTPQNAGIAAVVNTGSDSKKGVVIFGNSATQSANLLELQDHTFTTNFSVDQDGNAYIPQINDVNGNEQVVFTATGSAVNYLGITNAATTNGPTISAAGGDTNIDLNLTPKGSGVVNITNGAVIDGISIDNGNIYGGGLSSITWGNLTGNYFLDSNSNEITEHNGVASAVNFLAITNAATGNGPQLEAKGGDTNIDLELLPKGTGLVKMTAGDGFDANSHAFGDSTEVDNGNSGTADTVDWGSGNFQKSTLTGNCTFTFTAPPVKGRYQLMLVQDATGSRTATWPAAVKWPGGTAPTLSTAANSIDIITFYYDGTNYYGVESLDFS